jgi:hypothetical protein
LPKKKIKPEQMRRMNRRFWILLSVGTLILVVLTLIDLHYLNLTYFEPR